MLNQCNFIGRLKQKPSFLQLSSVKFLVKFTLSVNRKFPNQDGEWVSDDIDFIAWGRLAEKIYNKFDKGDMMVVCGSYQNHTTTDKSGNKNVEAQIVVDYCRRLAQNNRQVGTPPVPAEPSPGSNFAMLEDDDKNLPF